jgi:long-chain acyl-CoA synthetase
MNVFDSLERAQIRFPNKPAMLFKGQPITYGDLYEQVYRLSAALRRCLQLRRGDRVAIFLPNTAEFITCYYAVEKIGAIAVALNVMLKRAEVEFIVRDCSPRVLITVPQFLDQVPEGIATLAGIVVVGETNRPGCMQFSDLLSERPPAAEPADRVESEDGAAILYTSGTTGQAKGVLLTHGNLRFNSQATHYHTQMTEDDRLLCYLPLFHCFGQNFIMNTSVHVGATLLLHERFIPDEVLDSAAANQATMFFGVPAVFTRLLALPNIEPKLESIRYYFSAAAPMSVPTVRSWRERFGKIIYEGYGLTETAPLASYNHGTDYREGSVGTAVQYVKIKVVNDRDEKVASGELGEIAIKGGNVMKGYFNRPRETAQVLRDGWFFTGDIGRMDDDGYLYLVDRAKDMINVSGFKVWPREVEDVLAKHLAVTEAAVVGVPDPVSGEAVKAFVALQKGAQLCKKDLIDFCRDRMAVYKAPRSVEFIDALPRNAAGKVLKRELRLRPAASRKVA